MTHYTVQARQGDPFVEIFETDSYGGDPKLIGIEPPLGTPISAARFSPERDKMALVYDVRIESIPGIGGPSQPPPHNGFAIVSAQDRFILFGGSATEDPVLYRRASPTYARHASAMPATTQHFSHGTFSHSDYYLALVDSTAPTIVNVHRFTGESFVPQGSITFIGAIDEVSFSPGDSYIVVKGGGTYRLYGKATLSEVTGTPAGKLLAVAPNDARLVIASGTTDLQVHGLVAGSWSLVAPLPSSGGYDQIASFSPNGTVIAVSVNTTSTSATVSYSPVFYAEHAGAFHITGTNEFHGQIPSGNAFSGDGQVFVSSRKPVSGNGEVAIFRPAETVLPPMSAVSVVDNNATVSGLVALSRDGQRLILKGASTTSYRTYTKNPTTGLFVLEHTFTGGNFSTALFSPSGAYLLLTSSSGTSSVVMKFNPATHQWGLFQTITYASSYSDLAWSGSDDLFALMRGNVIDLYRFNGTVFTVAATTTVSLSLYGLERNFCVSPSGQYLAFLDTRTSSTGLGDLCVRILSVNGSVITDRGQYLTNAVAAAFSPTANWLTVHKNMGDSTGRLTNIRLDEPSFTILPDTAVNFIIRPRALLYASDGQSLLTVSDNGSANQPARLLSVVGEGFSVVGESPAVFDGTISQVSATGGGDLLAVSHFLPTMHVTFMKNIGAVELPTYELEHVVPAGTDLPVIQALSPSGASVHVSSGAANIHVMTGAPYSAISPLPFASSEDPATVQVVHYGAKFVLWRANGAFNVTIVNGAGDFVELSRLNGTFVGLYRMQGNSFVEMDFATHDRGTEISDMVFSRHAIAFSYFALCPENPSSGTQGRHVYNVAATLDLTGVEWVSDMQRSFLAFSPGETHFAATYERPGGLSDVALCKFRDSTLIYDRKDSELVAFGPVDFSSCNDIVVAHGGLPDPFTFYKVSESDLLLLQPSPIVDWDHGGVIVNVGFLTCGKLLVITPEEIVTADPGEGEEAVPRDDSSPADHIDIDPDTSTIDLPPADGIGDDGGSYGVGPSTPGWGPGGITPLTYVPYVAVDVFYRE